MRSNKTYLHLVSLEDSCTPAGGTTANEWTDANGTKLWSDKYHWSLGHVPTTSEDATFKSVEGTSDACN